MTLLFEKFGFATDNYLGNLTVSPNNLGTAMKLQLTLTLSSSPNILDRDIGLKIKHDSHIDYAKLNNTTHTMTTTKSLAAAYNEML